MGDLEGGGGLRPAKEMPRGARQQKKGFIRAVVLVGMCFVGNVAHLGNVLSLCFVLSRHADLSAQNNCCLSIGKSHSVP